MRPLAFALLLGACDEPGACGPPTEYIPISLESGVLSSEGASPPIDLEVDRARATVTLTHVVNGRTLVETYRITGAERVRTP